MQRPIHKRQYLIWATVAVVVSIGVLGLAFSLFDGVMAAVDPAGEQNGTVAGINARLQTTQTVTASQPTGDLACILCHSETEAELHFPSGETRSVQVDPDVVATSAHGTVADPALGCTDCHAPAQYQFPHAPVEAENARSYALARSDSCQQCHVDPHITSHPGPDDPGTPVGCTDCHGSHDVLTVDAWQAGEGTEQCVACHTELEIETQDPQELTAIVQNGLFAQRSDNDYCLACHSRPDLTYTFENGDTLSLTIDEDKFHDSVHGTDNPWQPLACTDCHEDYRFPHESIVPTSERAYSLDMYPLCSKCHQPKYEDAQDSVHGRALAEGNENAAVCTDCHGAHDIPVPNEPRQRISQTCRQCHSTIYDEYATSVHGEALIGESNPDVATCIDCHGVHNITDPTTVSFRNRSPELCAKCHADEALMQKYDISTDVFETYVADFHGTTVTLFEQQDPTVETNKAVCYDCHGVHDIRSPDDPDAGIKANLLETCRQCHPDASANFPDSWTSHFKPSLQNNPGVFLVNWFYRLVIPGTVGFFGFLVMTDIYRRVRERFSGRNE